MVLVDLGGYRIEQRQLDDFGFQMRGDDRAGIAVVAALGEMRQHVGLAQRADGFEGQKFGIAGAGADADEAAFLLGAHSPGLASALSAAAVMALPPRRPRTMA